MNAASSAPRSEGTSRRVGSSLTSTVSISKSSISGLASSFSQSSGSRAGSSASSSTMRPTRTCSTPSKPSAGSARSTALPCGSRMPSFGRIRTRAFGHLEASAP